MDQPYPSSFSPNKTCYRNFKIKNSITNKNPLNGGFIVLEARLKKSWMLAVNVLKLLFDCTLKKLREIWLDVGELSWKLMNAQSTLSHFNSSLLFILLIFLLSLVDSLHVQIDLNPKVAIFDRWKWKIAIKNKFEWNWACYKTNHYIC